MSTSQGRELLTHHERSPRGADDEAPPHPAAGAPNLVRVETGGRLHFGMYCFGARGARHYGGAGVMIDAPRVQLVVGPADAFTVRGCEAARALGFARRWLQARRIDRAPPLAIEVRSVLPRHVGLGSGTQLGLAVAAGLEAALDRPAPSIAQRALAVGRGARSAVGLYGFDRGGLVVEGGKLASEAISPLVDRVALPAAWRFVLFWPQAAHGISGAAEDAAFARLPPVAAEQTDALCRETTDELLPAAREGDFHRFSRSLYRFGRLAGECFAARQGGPFASPRVAQLVAALRRLGVEGVGQSSWGPLVFALAADEAQAHELTAQVGGLPERQGTSCTIAAVRNEPARCTREISPAGDGCK